MFEAIDTGSDPSDVPVSEVVRAGNLVWSVHVSEDPVNGGLVLGDIETQTRRTLGNLDIAIRAAGGTLADVVQVQVFLVEKTDSAGMNKVYAEYFKEPYPVRATVVVKELLAEGLRIEILAHAVLGEAAK
ncbi:RidA family protein [Sinorhizobium sp. BG8]|uniref:RidA family protein n=1 Tax=Sinorhizobium sp. BG8 TaxID=2613773 RepID=UPI00193CD5D2|nr:RidA family protein [Sinorhizobium sp. BG8]QRM56156.1 RidA family protein [Sinorhizobium sp. BG8]